MSVILLQVFVSLMLVAGSATLFVFTVRSKTFEHADRLSLAPLEDDAAAAPQDSATSSPLSPGPGAFE